MLNGHPELCGVAEGPAVDVEVEVELEVEMAVATEFPSTTKSLVKNLSNIGNGCIWRIAEINVGEGKRRGKR